MTVHAMLALLSGILTHVQALESGPIGNAQDSTPRVVQRVLDFMISPAAAGESPTERDRAAIKDLDLKKGMKLETIVQPKAGKSGVVYTVERQRDLLKMLNGE